MHQVQEVSLPGLFREGVRRARIGVQAWFRLGGARVNRFRLVRVVDDFRHRE